MESDIKVRLFSFEIEHFNGTLVLLEWGIGHLREVEMDSSLLLGEGGITVTASYLGVSSYTAATL